MIQQSPEISIVMPCLNEAETLADCIREAQSAFVESGFNGEIVVADNGSVDGSQKIASDLGARVVSVSQPGYGCALRGGISASRAPYIVMGDSDGSYDFRHAPIFVEKLRDGGFDLVMGNRFHGGIKSGAMPWLHRYIGNPVLSTIGRILFHCPAGDFHCGLRGLRKSAFRKMQLTSTGMEFASEMVIKATLKGLRVSEIPTVLRPDGRSRSPHLRSWRDGWRHLKLMLLLCPRWLFLIPGMLLCFVSLLLMVAIAYSNPLRIAGIELSVNSSIACAMGIVLGYQLAVTGRHAFELAEYICGIRRERDMAIPNRGLERGILIGAAVLVAGIGLLLYALLLWRDVGFGQLDSLVSVRWVIPSITLIILGTQTVFGTFFMALVRLALKPSRQIKFSESHQHKDLKRQ